MNLSVYYKENSFLINLQFSPKEQGIENVDIDAAVQSDVVIKDTKAFKEHLIKLMQCLESVKSTDSEDI